jgi:exodeoxyribonuclease VII large subunit
MIKGALERGLPGRVTVCGQLSGFKVHRSSGHCYFSLKDDNAVLPAVMWSSKYKGVKFSPADGLEVIARGYVDIYEPQGKYQLYVDKLEPAGVGALQLAFEQMVEKLKGEGLFADEHKKALPRYAMTVGVVTSSSGAAFGDIRDSIFQRWPCGRIVFEGCQVQGPGAAEDIARAIGKVNRFSERFGIDVLIVGRGGGSLEDLWAFNEEAVARAIFSSSIPVISAVGHEVDFTIADMVADARAATPTKAAVMAVPDFHDVLNTLEAAETTLRQRLGGKLETQRARLEKVTGSFFFREPKRILAAFAQRLDDSNNVLEDSVYEVLNVRREELWVLFEKLSAKKPARLVSDKKMQTIRLRGRAAAAVRERLSRAKLSLGRCENKLSVMDPKAVLRRGYSITTNKRTNRIIASKGDAAVGDTIITEFGDRNLIESKVEKA